jgi:hypothetical protein
MQSGKLTSRLTTLAMAIATSACAPHASHAQDAPPAAPVEVAPEATPAQPAQPAAPARPASPTTRSKDERVRAEQARVKEEMARVQQNIAKQHADLAKVYADFGKRDGAMKFLWAGRAPSPDTPLVISTQPTDETAAGEWAEDLKVMDKLVREEIARSGGDDPQAMGIKLTMVGRSAPMYVEGAGAIFSAAVNFPLAPIGATAKKEDKPRNAASKWEQAKRELNGYPVPARIRLDPGQEASDEGPALAFDQAKLDQLVNAVAKAMIEASNIRHLPENESVIVTIAGIDEGAMPVRLTLKASKGAIDAAASGKVSAEEFAKQVSRRVG